MFFSDAICESNPRIIEDARARKLASDLKRCAYYETCATYGLNVERVFQDGKGSRKRIYFRGGEASLKLKSFNTSILVKKLYSYNKSLKTTNLKNVIRKLIPIANFIWKHKLYLAYTTNNIHLFFFSLSEDCLCEGVRRVPAHHPQQLRPQTIHDIHVLPDKRVSISSRLRKASFNKNIFF